MMKNYANIYLLISTVLLSACEKLVFNWDLPKLPIIETLEPEDFCCLSVKVGCNLIYEGGSSAICGVCYSQFPNPTTQDNLVICGEEVGTYTIFIHNLLDNTTYYIRAFAFNDEGTAYGEQKQFTTGTGQSDTFTDTRDGKTYKTVKIGNQTWMAENLAYLPKVSPPSQGSLSEGYYYVYGYIGSSITAAKATNDYNTYGVLYNWQAAITACPAGWHLPTDDEWTTLEKFLGDNEGGKLKETGTKHWTSPNNGATNSSGFTALPGGFRYNNGVFYRKGEYSYWWSSTKNHFNNAWYRETNYFFDDVSRVAYQVDFGLSVRCVRN